MKHITSPYQPDVLVAGGGTAGCAAAIAAARRGHRVLLLEESNHLGGISSGGGISEFYASPQGLGDIFDRVWSELAAYGVIRDRFYNGEYLKIIWQLLADEAGVDILFHTTLLDGIKIGNKVQAVLAASASHVFEIQAKVFIDATGEGDLAMLAGAEYHKGHPQNGRTLHMSLAAMFYNTGMVRPSYLPSHLSPIPTKEELPGLHGPYGMADGRLYANMVKIMHHDPTDPFSLSDAEREGRRQLARIESYVQQRYPTYALSSSGSRIGIREGRRITGDYILTEADITGSEPRDFPDGVAVATAQIDFHSLTKPGHAGWRQHVEPYAIPYRCLTPKGIANMLTAGKCISGDQVAHSSYRMTPTVCMIGQAAGTAAAIFTEQSCQDVRQVDINPFREILTRDGMQLDPRAHHAFSPELSADPGKGG
jgi:hypothetical protein